MSPLTPLHHRLSALRQRRRLVRWSLAGTAVTIAVLWSLAAIFALDVGFALSVAQRIALMALSLAAVVWAIRRFSLPWLGIRETETDVALFVERQHRIDSDLVAALQFDRAASERWGSRELQSAVVSRIADVSRQLDVTHGMDYAPLIRRAKVLGISLLIAAVVLILFPRHVAVFFSRLLLSERHYPSDTTIEKITLNNIDVLEWNPYSARPRNVRSAKGRPVRFVVEGRGDLPVSGAIECRSLLHGTSRQLELRQLADDEFVGWAFPSRLKGDARTSQAKKNGAADANSVTHGSAWYVAEMPHLVETFTYTLRLGDTWTESAQVEMIEPPVVEMSLNVEPPSYAGSAAASKQSPRHLSVLEGSRVSIDLRCVNHKPLESATITVGSGDSSTNHSLVKESSDALEWSLPPNTPLANVTGELRYELQVLDQDGLGLESPVAGLVQLKVDRPPTAVASVVHRVVLPDAKPVIEYRLNDDYGVATAELQAQIERMQAPGSATEVPDERFEQKIVLDPTPLTSQNLPYRGKFSLDLARFKLAKGDQLKLTLAVVDYRGQNAGKSESSEPLLLEVSDEAGVLAAITEADERSEKRLSDVIKQELGVGGTK